MAVCQTREELEAERKRVEEMCVGTSVRSVECWRYLKASFHPKSVPAFNGPPQYYEAAIGIVEGKPVFDGDVLYDFEGCAYTAPWAEPGSRMSFPEGNGWSWTRPTKNLVTVDLETHSDMADATSYSLHGYQKEILRQIGKASINEAAKLYGLTQLKETTMTKFFEEKKFAYLEGRDITHLSNDEILGAISRAEKRLDKLSELKNKPKMVKDEMDTLTLDLQNLITYLDERQAEKDSDE